ncbi:hypothetical protein [Aeromicrobium sp. PE09-221]|uniref:hypothetical protein n=1 Tax=Aeromicrobium sp. PE09-221 TaxID=1898043 RepID=UPI00112275B9|nr:hypothetical protein [Aeromicrobium sp. PE09-221]
MHPVLPPGATVLRCGPGQLQVGTTPPLRVPDLPGTAQILRHADGATSALALAEIAERDGARNGRRLVSSLLSRGALVPSVPGEGSFPGITIAYEPLTARFATTLETAASSPGDDVTILASFGEPRRSAIRDLGERGLTHLPVVFIQGCARIGPLTHPGSSPCLDCYDADRSRTDPAWRVVAVQLGAGRPAGGPPPRALMLSAVGHTLELLRLDRIGTVVTVGQGCEAGVSEPVGWDDACPCQLLAA